jgi:hypothetical protein
MKLTYNMNIIHNTNFIILCYSSACTSNRQWRKQFYHIYNPLKFGNLEAWLFQMLNE